MSKNTKVIIRNYKFRLYPSKEQKEHLNKHLELSKNLWNELLSFCKTFYKDFHLFPTRTTLQRMVKNYGMFSQTQQGVSHRIYNSIMRVFRLRKKGIKVGFPRFKSKERMKSLHYPQNGTGFRLNKAKLRINPFGKINVKKHREIEGRIKTLTLKREATRKWYAIFAVIREKVKPKKNNGNEVGIDLGLIKFATLSNGTVVKNPRHLRKHEGRLKFHQRKLSRKKKRSKNRKKAKLKVSKIYEKVKNIRSDFLHKLSTTLVYNYSLIALEKLNSKEMVKVNYGKSINDASWSNFTSMLSYKAEEADCRVVFVNPKNTSKLCSGCNALINKELEERIHKCPNCGLSMNRDLNASINILNRATFGERGSNTCGDITMVMSGKQGVPNKPRDNPHILE